MSETASAMAEYTFDSSESPMTNQSGSTPGNDSRTKEGCKDTKNIKKELVRNWMEKLVVPCPKCEKGENVLMILYGYPSSEAMKQAQDGHIILGGCCPRKGSNWKCKTCGHIY